MCLIIGPIHTALSQYRTNQTQPNLPKEKYFFLSNPRREKVCLVPIKDIQTNTKLESWYWRLTQLQNTLANYFLQNLNYSLLLFVECRRKGKIINKRNLGWVGFKRERCLCRQLEQQASYVYL